MLGFLAAMLKTAKWSGDPNQRRLALMIFDAAIHKSSGQARGKPLDLDAILALTRDSGWSEKESTDRFVHALSLIKPIADKETYRAAKDEGERLRAVFAGLPRERPDRKAA